MKSTAIISLFLLLACRPVVKTAGQTGNSKPTGTIINVKSYGAKGDGEANDYAAIQKAIAELNRLKTGTLYFPKGIYKVDEFHRENEKGQTLNNRYHFVFTGLSNATIRGDKGAIISIKGNYRKKSEWVYKERNYGYSFDQQISFIFRQCRNLTIENLEINGNCDKMTREEIVVENVSYGLLFGQEVADNNENIVIRDCYIHHISTDGISWRGTGGGLLMENVRLKNNGRCALSILQGKNMRFVNCDFSETGVTGKYVSHSPNTGCDIENESFTTIENIFFKNCRFVKNKNTQFIASGFDGIGAGRTINVHLDSCYFEENREIEPLHDRTVTITTDNSSITNSTIIGTLNFDVNGCYNGGQPGKGVEVKNCTIKTKGNGIRINCDFKVRIEDCLIEQLPYLDEQAAQVSFPFIVGGQDVYIENNKFIYQSSNWRQNHSSIAWDLNNHYQGCRSVKDNKLMLKEQPDKKMPPKAVYIIMIDQKFLGKNEIVGTDKIVFTLY